MQVDMRAVKALWGQYTEWKAQELAASTIAKDYRFVGRVIAKIPPDASSAREVAEWLRDPEGGAYSTESTRRILMQLGACYSWAMGMEFVTSNPWAALPKIKAVRSPDRCKAFTDREQEVILKAFRAQSPKYANWVEFLFRVGCRPSEAAALRWADISLDCKTIHISKARPIGVAEDQSTKTHTERTFTVGPKVQRLLKQMRKAGPCLPQDRLFPARNNAPFNYSNFLRRYWEPIVNELVARGEVRQYLPQKNCRHTKGTALHQAGIPVKDASAILGNTPKVFLSNYADRSRDLSCPD